MITSYSINLHIFKEVFEKYLYIKMKRVNINFTITTEAQIVSNNIE